MSTRADVGGRVGRRARRDWRWRLHHSSSADSGPAATASVVTTTTTTVASTPGSSPIDATTRSVIAAATRLEAQLTGARSQLQAALQRAAERSGSATTTASELATNGRRSMPNHCGLRAKPRRSRKSVHSSRPRLRSSTPTTRAPARRPRRPRPRRRRTRVPLRRSRRAPRCRAVRRRPRRRRRVRPRPPSANTEMIRLRKKDHDHSSDARVDSTLSPELLRARARRAEHRGRGSRAFSRAADRRRIVPATIVGSLVLVGVGVTDAAVQRTIPPTTTPTTLPETTTTTVASSADAAELQAVARSLTADQSALAALQRRRRTRRRAQLEVADPPRALRAGRPAGPASTSRAP